MLRLKAYKFELKPKPGQATAFRRVAGCCRLVFNHALAEQKARHERDEKHLGYGDLCKELTAWKREEETAFLGEAPSQPLQQALKDLGRAYTNFFVGRAAFPRFKKRGQRDSFRYPQPKPEHIDQANSRVFLPKIGWVRYRNSRVIEGMPKNLTIAMEAGRWYVAIQTERAVPDPLPATDSAVGIDLGVARFATLSDGIVYKPLGSFRGLERQRLGNSASWPEKRSFPATGRSRKPASPRYITASAMRARTTYTRSRPPSAKTTRW